MRRVVIKEEYCALLDGDPIAAAILWLLESQMVDGSVRVSVAQLQEDLLGLCTDRHIRGRLALLEARGFLSGSKGYKVGKLYQVNSTAIETAVAQVVGPSFRSKGRISAESFGQRDEYNRKVIRSKGRISGAIIFGQRDEYKSPAKIASQTDGAELYSVKGTNMDSADIRSKGRISSRAVVIPTTILDATTTFPDPSCINNYSRVPGDVPPSPPTAPTPIVHVSPGNTATRAEPSASTHTPCSVLQDVVPSTTNTPTAVPIAEIPRTIPIPIQPADPAHDSSTLSSRATPKPVSTSSATMLTDRATASHPAQPSQPEIASQIAQETLSWPTPSQPPKNPLPAQLELNQALPQAIPAGPAIPVMQQLAIIHEASGGLLAVNGRKRYPPIRTLDIEPDPRTMSKVAMCMMESGLCDEELRELGHMIKAKSKFPFKGRTEDTYPLTLLIRDTIWGPLVQEVRATVKKRQVAAQPKVQIVRGVARPLPEGRAPYGDAEIYWMFSMGKLSRAEWPELSAQVPEGKKVYNPMNEGLEDDE